MSSTHEQARQLMLAYRRQHGRRETAEFLKSLGVPEGLAEIDQAQELKVIEALSAKLPAHAVAVAKQRAEQPDADHEDGDDDREPSGKPKTFADLIEPAYAKFNGAGRNRQGQIR